MTNLKKIGLTALAGSLAATRICTSRCTYVTGTARMEYQSTQASSYVTDHLHKAINSIFWFR